MTQFEEYFNGKKILVLSNSVSWLNVIENHFQKYNIEVKKYSSSEELFDQQMDLSYANAIIVDFHLINQENTLDVIKKIRIISPTLLILTASKYFAGNNCLTSTKKMIKALNAGSNRVTYKCLDSIEHILFTHFKVRDLNLLEKEKLLF